jgi:glycosyltransferase involved in cell wall biosynthesis
MIQRIWNSCLGSWVKTCVVIATYNNDATLADVIRRTLKVKSDLIIVDDGSTDGTRGTLASMERVEVLTHPVNRGKGDALMTGIRRARELGYQRAITLDSDNQHDPADIRKFEEAAVRHPSSLVIGVRDMRAAGAPLKSRLGRWLSNVGILFFCGHRVADAQSGYRSYPIDSLLALRPRTARFEFEYEVLLRSAWADVPFAYTPITVRYPRGKDRLSHFRPLRDCVRVLYCGLWTALTIRFRK